MLGEWGTSGRKLRTGGVFLSTEVFVSWQCVSMAVLTRGCGFGDWVGGISLTVGPPGNVNVFFPRSSRQRAC